MCTDTGPWPANRFLVWPTVKVVTCTVQGSILPNILKSINSSHVVNYCGNTTMWTFPHDIFAMLSLWYLYLRYDKYALLMSHRIMLHCRKLFVRRIFMHHSPISFNCIPPEWFVFNVSYVHMFFILCSDSFHLFWLEKMCFQIGIIAVHVV